MLAGYQLKAYVESHGVSEVEVLDFPAIISPENLVARILNAKPDVLGFSIYTWNVELLKSAAPLLRRRSGEVHFVCGGPDVSRLTMESMAQVGLGDFFIEGEGEAPLMALLSHLARNSTDSVLIPGISVWKNGELRRGNPLALEPLEAIPSPYLSGAVPSRLLERQQAFIETQRGCRNRCRYCLYHRGRPSVSYFPLDRVLEEIRHLVVDCNVASLRIIDPIFTSDLLRAKAVLRLLAELKIDHDLPRCYWEFMCHDVDEEFLYLAALLKDRDGICNTESLEPKDCPQHYSEMLQGYKAINCFGIQSLHIPSLKASQRPGISRSKFARFMEDVRRHNLLLKLDMILGLPEETAETFRAGLDFLLPYLRHTDHVLNIHRLQVLPGTEFEDMTESLGLQCSTGSHFVQSTSAMDQGEMNWLSRQCGILFRVLNSPLREDWFQAIERGGLSHTGLLIRLDALISSDSTTQSSRLVADDSIDDMYWNNDIFREIKSAWLRSALASL